MKQVKGIDNKKEMERAELHRTIWGIANDLRGSVDGWDFKQYVLGMLFYRYISENLASYIEKGEREAGATDFIYADLSDEDAEQARSDLVNTRGFFILPSELFCNVLKKAPLDENLNETLENVFRNIEASAQGTASEDDFKGLFDDMDVNSNKLGGTVAKRNEKLVKLMEGIAGMKLGDYQENTIDAFGDAYEYLMTMYASQAGKSGGEFYTPQEVSELLARITLLGKTSVNKVYDPACGSGSLLLKYAKILGKDNVRQGFFGQEINITTYNLCRINMFLHDIPYDKFDIALGDTLTEPKHWNEEPFEAIVSNPPYSIKWEGNANPLLINDPRFSPAGVLAPKQWADMAFIMHSLSWLATNGTAAIVCFPGIMYRPRAEQKIRKYLVDNNYIDCIIQLPENLFFGTSIATCIMVLKKSKVDNSILFIDASAKYIKVTNNNKLSEGNISEILDLYEKRTDVEYLSALISYEKVSSNNYTLSVSSYVKKNDVQDIIDIDVLNAEIEEIVSRENELRIEIQKIIEVIDESFDHLTSEERERQGVRWMTIEDIFILKNGYTPSKNVPGYWNGSFPWFRMEDIRLNGNILSDSIVKISEEAVKKEPFPANTIIVATSATIGEHALITTPFLCNQRFTCLILKEEFKQLYNPLFLYYYSYILDDWCLKNTKQSSFLSVNMDRFKQFKFPLIPIQEQDRIVLCLDKFRNLCNNLCDVIPAEIEARRKQYGYYRDKLLSFNGASS